MAARGVFHPRPNMERIGRDTETNLWVWDAQDGTFWESSDWAGGNMQPLGTEADRRLERRSSGLFFPISAPATQLNFEDSEQQPETLRDEARQGVSKAESTPSTSSQQPLTPPTMTDEERLPTFGEIWSGPNPVEREDRLRDDVREGLVRAGRAVAEATHVTRFRRRQNNNNEDNRPRTSPEGAGPRPPSSPDTNNRPGTSPEGSTAPPFRPWFPVGHDRRRGVVIPPPLQREEQPQRQRERQWREPPPSYTPAPAYSPPRRPPPSPPRRQPPPPPRSQRPRPRSRIPTPIQVTRFAELPIHHPRPVRRYFPRPVTSQTFGFDSPPESETRDRTRSRIPVRIPTRRSSRRPEPRVVSPLSVHDNVPGNPGPASPLEARREPALARRGAARTGASTRGGAARR